jgi:hypothetical protein
MTRQRTICAIHGAAFDPPVPGSKVGIATNVKSDTHPINGLRHPPNGDTNGWYIWAGEELSNEPDFFKALHIEHLFDWCPMVLDYLALPPGWRFLLADKHSDVWYDPSLLEV